MFQMLTVEFANIKEGTKALVDFMTSKGYTTLQSFPDEEQNHNWATMDKIFIKKGSGFKETRDKRV
jgi:hypothetical protein